MNRLKISPKSLLLLAVVLFLVLAFHFRGAANISGRLIGTWQSDNPYATQQTTFHWDGTYEQVINDQIIFEGHYSESKGFFRLYNFQRYNLSSDSTYVLFEPCKDSLECVGENEVANLDEEMSKDGYIYHLKTFDWKAGKIIVSTKPFASRPTATETWTRQ